MTHETQPSVIYFCKDPQPHEILHVLYDKKSKIFIDGDEICCVCPIVDSKQEPIKMHVGLRLSYNTQ